MHIQHRAEALVEVQARSLLWRGGALAALLRACAAAEYVGGHACKHSHMLQHQWCCAVRSSNNWDLCGGISHVYFQRSNA